MTAQNFKQLTVGLILGACLVAVIMTPKTHTPNTSSVQRDPVVLGHRINSQGQEQLVYGK